MTSPLRDLLDHRLIVVTGKGGTGKTAVSCLLAEAARRAGKRVLIAETSATESIVTRFESAPKPVGYAGRELRPGLFAVHVDPHEALADYVRLQTGLGVVTDRILHSETFQQLLEAAPGWRELIVLGKVWHLEQKQDARGRPLYDLIVVDAPATGHGLTFLDVPRVVQQAVRAGPLARHASWVEAMVHDRERTLLLPVTLPEELPVLETCELIARARGEVDIAVDRVVVNRMPSRLASRALACLDRLPPSLSPESLPPVPAMRAMLEHESRREAIAVAWRRSVSARCGLPVVDLPSLPRGFEPDGDWAAFADVILRPAVWPGEPGAAAATATPGGADASGVDAA
ncbi:MAG: ArsA family ATPase [Spirochaetaceae bacterium]|nr:ArsA family ATPase [Myxococcales bacterium]MCB9724548.1 ArsA family ATPase [Spirochaetaceae bacterium]HPG28202.1 ArsA family ATPase [Myxococcota bacterium]